MVFASFFVVTLTTLMPPAKIRNLIESLDEEYVSLNHIYWPFACVDFITDLYINKFIVLVEYVN